MKIGLGTFGALCAALALTASAGERQAGNIKIKAGIIPVPEHSKLIIARDKGFFAQAGDNPKGLIVASGCSLATETPFENIHAMLDAVREIGQPVKKEAL